MSASDLQLIIDYYGTEKNSIEISLADCVAEGDYEMAKYLSGELTRLEFTLGTLYRLQGNYNMLRYPLESKKRRLQSMLREFPDNPSRQFYMDQVAGIDQQLSTISLHIKPAVMSGQEFDDAVFDVVEGRGNRFQAYPQKRSKSMDRFFVPQAIQYYLLLSHRCNKLRTKISSTYCLKIPSAHSVFSMPPPQIPGRTAMIPPVLRVLMQSRPW